MECWLLYASATDRNLSCKGHSYHVEVGSRPASSMDFLISKSIQVINGNRVAID